MTSLSPLDSVPVVQYTFEPGQTLAVPIAGVGTMSVTGEWTDHIPLLLNESKDVDPGPRELRVHSPLLLRDNKVVGDLEGGGAVTDKLDWGIFFYMPGEGRFQLSLQPVPGAVAGRLRLNRLVFASEGASYALVTGTPIARGGTVWVLRDRNFQPGENTHGAYIGSTAVTPVPAPDTGTR